MHLSFFEDNETWYGIYQCAEHCINLGFLIDCGSLLSKFGVQSHMLMVQQNISCKCISVMCYHKTIIPGITR